MGKESCRQGSVCRDGHQCITADSNVQRSAPSRTTVNPLVYNESLFPTELNSTVISEAKLPSCRASKERTQLDLTSHGTCGLNMSHRRHPPRKPTLLEAEVRSTSTARADTPTPSSAARKWHHPFYRSNTCHSLTAVQTFNILRKRYKPVRTSKPQLRFTSPPVQAASKSAHDGAASSVKNITEINLSARRTARKPDGLDTRPT
jgi:hypothetical protein